MKSKGSKSALIIFSAVVFFAVINGTMINLALPFVGRDFNVTEGTYGWISTVYALMFGIFSAINGRIGDIVGMRRLYLAGLLVFGFGAIAVALSPSIEIAIILRGFHGAGAAALPVLGSSMIARLFSPQDRGWAMGVILSVVGVAASIGPFIGGIILQSYSWRVVFLFAGLSLFIWPFAFKAIPKTMDTRSKNATFDLVGALLMGGGVSALIYSFQVLKNTGATLHFASIVALGLILLMGFWIWINRTQTPFAPPAILRNGQYLATCFVAFLSNATRFGTIVLVPIFLTEVNKLAPIWTGVVLIPGAIAIAFLSPKFGQMGSNRGAHCPIFIGTIFLILGNLITAFYTGGSPIGVAVGMGLYGIGFAGIQSPSVTAVSLIVPKEITGVGVGIFMMIFFIGGAFGVAISVTAVELQAVDALSWLGFEGLGMGARYSNAMLVLTALAVAGLALNPFIPRKNAAQIVL